jgi:hypothetical protein
VLRQASIGTTLLPAHAQTVVQHASQLLRLHLFSVRHLSSKKKVDSKGHSTVRRTDRRGKLGSYGKALCLSRYLAVAAELASAIQRSPRVGRKSPPLPSFKRYTLHGQHGAPRLIQCGPKPLPLPIKTFASRRNPQQNSNPAKHFMVPFLSLSFI